MPMSTRQHATPVLVHGLGADESEKLSPIPPGSPPFGEETLQQLLAAHPSLLPIEELEPAFGPPVCLGREIGTSAGCMDLLYSSPAGYLTLVETKLWKNPQARREVVGQVIDYARDLAQWDFDKLDAAVRKARVSMRQEELGVFDILKEQDADLDEATTIASVNRGLRRGRILLLIVGDIIREGVVKISEFIHTTPSLHFSLALVELALYRQSPDADWPVYVQPRVVERTSEVVRAVVEVRAPRDLEVEVALPAEPEGVQKAKPRLTEALFYEELAENAGEETADEVRELSSELEALGLVPRFRKASVSMRLPDPAGATGEFTIIVVRVTGTAFVGWLNSLQERGGYDPSIGNAYLAEFARLTGATIVKDWTRDVPVSTLLGHKDGVVSAVETLVSGLGEEAEETG